MKAKTDPLSYRIIKIEGEYYLYCIFDWKEDGKTWPVPRMNEKQKGDEEILAAVSRMKRKHPGAIGIDINKGFFAVSGINTHGGLIGTFDVTYRFKAGNKTASDMAWFCSRMVYMALALDVPIVIEDISLTNKKSRCRKKANKAINSMLHSFAYKQYKELMENCCYRYGVKLIKVDPRWTSEIARRAYCIPMKLCVHNAAALVIARKGMNFIDSLPKKLSKADKARLFIKRSAAEKKTEPGLGFFTDDPDDPCSTF